HNDVEKKVVSEQKLALSAHSKPSMKPRTDGLVVLSLPLRSREHIWNTQISSKWNGSFSGLDEETVIALIAAHCIQHNGGAALQAFGERFHAKGDRRIGFYVLLSGSGMAINPGQRHQWNGTHAPMLFDIASEHPNSPLALYLAYHHDLLWKGQPPTELG